MFEINRKTCPNLTQFSVNLIGWLISDRVHMTINNKNNFFETRNE